LLKEADVVVYDRLVSLDIMNRVPAGIPRIFVGKSDGHHPIPQNEINQLLVRLARRHYRVVRLKGGDPFIFGRGGEEAQYLASHRVSFEVVPGVTAAVACADYAGIPLTHRGLSTGVHFVTGHCQADLPLALDWHRLAEPDTTLVVYMGLANIREITRELIRAGLGRETPAAIIERGTTSNQRRIITTLGELIDRVTELDVRAPALIVIGRVVSLAHELEWFTPESGSDFGQQHAVEILSYA
jgi:uroporphyrin-III C-methyltransferase/precorrin-2 dehydrogenase/sirohydrochlorin ferrochelatase/uroporphyrin-III C-methyltransferase